MAGVLVKHYDRAVLLYDFVSAQYDVESSTTRLQLQHLRDGLLHQDFHRGLPTAPGHLQERPPKPKQFSSHSSQLYLGLLRA